MNQQAEIDQAANEYAKGMAYAERVRFDFRAGAQWGIEHERKNAPGTIGNHWVSRKIYDSRIAELEKKLEIAREALEKTRYNGKHFGSSKRMLELVEEALAAINSPVSLSAKESNSIVIEPKSGYLKSETGNPECDLEQRQEDAIEAAKKPEVKEWRND